MRDKTVKLYTALGFDIAENNGGELRATCLVCGKPKFYLSDDGAFDCKGCSIRGNDRTIAKILHDKIYAKALGPKQKAALSEWRGMPEDCFDSKSLGWDPIFKEWTALSPLSPGLKAWGLKRTKEIKGKRRFLALPGGEMGLFGADLIQPGGKETVYICEGEWDSLSFSWLLKANNARAYVVGVPGSTTFKDEWVEWMRGRKICALLDNDRGGLAGNGVLRKRLGNVAASIQYLHWPADLDGKWDVDKLIQEEIPERDPAEILEGIKRNLKATIQGSTEDKGKKTTQEQAQEATGPEAIDPSTVPQISYKELHACFGKWYHLPQALRDGLDIEIACLFAAKMNLRPAPWVYLVGPSSTGKSMLVESLDALEEAVFLSEVRGTTLVSGFSVQGGGDPSMLARFNDFGSGASKSVLLVGDMSVTMSQGSEEVQRVQSLLRDISNGRMYAAYGNGVIRDYKKLHVAILAGVTMEVWRIDTPEMGERFVKCIVCRSSGREKDDRLASEKAVRNTPFRKEMERETKEAVIGAMKRPIPEVIPYPAPENMGPFIDLGIFCERIRGSSKVDKFTNVQETNTNHAGGTRFATTLAVIATGAAVHLECSPTDERVLRLVRKITRDTPNHYRMILVKALYDMYQKKPFMVREVIPSIYRDMTTETAEMETAALFRMGVIHKTKTLCPDGVERIAWELDKGIHALIKKLRLFEDLDQSDPFSISFIPKQMTITRKKQ
jgi:uncharacterized protein YlaI